MISEPGLLLTEHLVLSSFLTSHLGESAKEGEEPRLPISGDLTIFLNSHPTAINNSSGKVLHLTRPQSCATHTLNLVATVDVDKGCTDKSYLETAVILGKHKILRNNQSQPT